VSSESTLESFVFGTMRLEQHDLDSCIDLLQHVLEAGVRRFHSSTEYGSFKLFCVALPHACARSGIDIDSLRHIVKLASPHFGESRFDESTMVSAVDEYRKSLEVDTLDVVQWMTRMDLADESARMNCLSRDNEAIANYAKNARADGNINRLGCFPYTRTFRDAVIQKPWCDTLVDYLNLDEREAYDSIPNLNDGQSIIAIRPLYPMFSESSDNSAARPSADECLTFSLQNDKVEAVVVSASSIEHADELVSIISRLRPKAEGPGRHPKS